MAERSGAAPDVRLAMIRLGEQARDIRDTLSRQHAEQGSPSRTWPWIRASLSGELDVAFVHTLNALQMLHEALFGGPEVLAVAEIGARVRAMRACIDHTLQLHRDVAAALPAGDPLREPVLAIIETPLTQIAGLFAAMQHALQAPIDGPAGHDAEIEIELSIALDFAAQLAAAEASASGASA
ncbi:MAG: hypothetical protein KDG55_03960 [Rhodocyclaceae bacterium]|nr:hypothetical protein [Rhodocyclaceae bacterium]